LFVLILATARSQRGELLAGPVVEVQLQAGAQPMAELGGSVKYSITVSNSGLAMATGVVVTHTLPAGFSYWPGSTKVVSDGQVISAVDPDVGNGSLAWGPFTLAAGWGVFDNHYGVHTFVQDLCSEAYVDFQLDKALDLVGVGGYVTQLLYPITRSTQGPNPCWVYFVSAAYDRGLIPIVRLQGQWGGDFWLKPESDSRGDYSSIAQAYRRVVQGLPRRDGSTLYVQVWNEPDLPLEWSGEANAEEYGHFFVDVARAVRGIGDPRIKILNGALTPGNVAFVRQLIAVPGFVGSFDLWASHCYPFNHPPTYNIHDGTARYPQYAIDCYLLELKALATYGGRRGVRVLLTETGYGLYDRTFRFEGYPTITEDNRAYYMKRAFRDFWASWPEVVGATPFELVDPYDTWARWDWLHPGTDVPHKQYSVVKALAKPEPVEIHPTQLTISFTATAAGVPGTYRSDVSATAANTTVDPLTGVAPVIVVGTLHTLSFPLAGAAGRPTEGGVAAAPQAAWSADMEEALERIDLATWEEEPWQQAPTRYLASAAAPWQQLKLIGRVHLGADPQALSLDASRGKAYVAVGAGSLVTVDTEDLRVRCRVPVGASPEATAVNQTTGAVYVANRVEGTLSVVQDGGCGPARIISRLVEPSGLAADEETNRLYVSCAQTGEVVTVDGETGLEVGRVKVGTYPETLALDRLHRLLYVANAGDGSLSVVNLDGPSVLRTIKICQGPLLDLAVDEASGRTYVLHLGPAPRRQVSVLDTESWELVASLAGGWERPLTDSDSLALDRGKGVIYLVSGQELLAVDASTLDLTSATVLDAVPAQSGVVADEASGKVYVVDSQRGDLVILGP
jgi:uncharacterized repeat protein (TIGR01451 family)